MLKTKNAKIISSLIAALIIMLCLPKSVSAHSVFIAADSSVETGQTVNIMAAWGHYPKPDGDLIGDGDVSWRLSVLRPDGTEQELAMTSAESGGGQHFTSSFVPESEGFYQVIFYRDRGIRRSRQQYETVKSYVRAGGVNTLESLTQTTSGGRLEFAADSDVSSLYWENQNSYSAFEGRLLFLGEPLANAELTLEDMHEEKTQFATDENGRFNISFTGRGVYLLMAEHIDESGETVIRTAHTLMLDVAGEASPPPNETAATDAGENAEEEIAAALPVDSSPRDSAADSVQEDLPSLFNTGHIIIFIVGGALLFGAGLLVGLAKR